MYCAAQSAAVVLVPSREGEGHHIIISLGLPAELAQHANDVQSSQRHHCGLARPWSCNQAGFCLRPNKLSLQSLGGEHFCVNWA